MELIDRKKIEWYGCNFETPRCESENRKCSECSHAECSHAQVMQLPSIKVKDNPTNGDMLKAMFPNINFGTLAQDDVIVNKDYSNNDEPQVFIPIKVWNTPYKGVKNGQRNDR